MNRAHGLLPLDLLDAHENRVSAMSSVRLKMSVI